MLAAEEARTLLAAIDTASVIGLRHRALIALMAFTFARVGAAIGMKVEDYFIQGRRGWVRLHEKGGKCHDVPAHHKLDEYLEEEYLAGAGLAAKPKASLVPTAKGWGDRLTDSPMSQADACRMIRRRAADAGKTSRGALFDGSQGRIYDLLDGLVAAANDGLNAALLFGRQMNRHGLVDSISAGRPRRQRYGDP